MVLKNDKEIFEALLNGERLERVRFEGFGEYIYLNDEGRLVNQEGKPANLYRLHTTDDFKIVKKD